MTKKHSVQKRFQNEVQQDISLSGASSRKKLRNNNKGYDLIFFNRDGFRMTLSPSISDMSIISKNSLPNRGS